MILLIITVIFSNTAQAQGALLSAHEAPLQLYREHLRTFSSLQEFQEFLPFYLEQIKEQRYTIYSNLEHITEFLSSNLGYIEQILTRDPKNLIIKKIHNILTKTKHIDDNMEKALQSWIFNSVDKDLFFRRRYAELKKALNTLQTKFNVGNDINIDDIKPDVRQLIIADLIKLYKELNLSPLKILEIKKEYDPSSIKDTNFFRYLEYISRHENLEKFAQNEFLRIGEEQRRIEKLERKLEKERKRAEEKQRQMNAMESSFLNSMESLEWYHPARFQELLDIHSIFNRSFGNVDTSLLNEEDYTQLIKRISNRPTVSLSSDPRVTLRNFGIVDRLDNLLHIIVEEDLLKSVKDEEEISTLFKQMVSESNRKQSIDKYSSLKDVLGYSFENYLNLKWQNFASYKESLDASVVFSNPPFFEWMKDDKYSEIIYAAYQLSFFVNYISPEKISELTERIKITQNRDLIKLMEIINIALRDIQIRVDKDECFHNFHTSKFITSHLVPYFAKNLLYYSYEKSLTLKFTELTDKINGHDFNEIIEIISNISKETETFKNIDYYIDNKELVKSLKLISRLALKKHENSALLKKFSNPEIIKMIYELVVTQHDGMGEIVPIIERIVNILVEHSIEDSSFDYLDILKKFNSISEFQKYYYYCPPNQYVYSYEIFDRNHRNLKRLEFSENRLEDFIADVIKTEPSFFDVIETVFLTLLNKHYVEKFSQAISSQDKELCVKEFKSFYKFVYRSSKSSLRLIILGRRNTDLSSRDKIDKLYNEWMQAPAQNTAVLNMLQILLEKGGINNPNAIFNLIESDDPLSKRN